MAIAPVPRKAARVITSMRLCRIRRLLGADWALPPKRPRLGQTPRHVETRGPTYHDDADLHAGARTSTRSATIAKSSTSWLTRGTRCTFAVAAIARSIARRRG